MLRVILCTRPLAYSACLSMQLCSNSLATTSTTSYVTLIKLVSRTCFGTGIPVILYSPWRTQFRRKCKCENFFSERQVVLVGVSLCIVSRLTSSQDVLGTLICTKSSLPGTCWVGSQRSLNPPPIVSTFNGMPLSYSPPSTSSAIYLSGHCVRHSHLQP